VVPASFKKTSAPLASSIISPSTSNVKSPASDIVLPFIVISSTVKVVKVPSDVIFDCAAVVTVAAVPEAFPVTLPVIFPTKLLPDKAVKVFAVNLKSSAPAILISIWSSVSAVIVVSPSASKINSLPSISRDPPNPASTILVPSEYTNLVVFSDTPKVIPVPDAVLNCTV